MKLPTILLAFLFAVFASPLASAEPLGSVSGLPGATGLAVNAAAHELYVKSAVSGTVWRVPIAGNGGLGAADPVSADLGTAVHIAFDLAGNLYAIQPGGSSSSLYLRRLPSGSVLAQQTRLSLDSFTTFDTTLPGAFAIESPGGTTSRLFFAVEPLGTYFMTLGAFAPGGSVLSPPVVGATCLGVRSFAYRPRFADLIATLSDSIVRISTSDDSCTPISGGSDFVRLEGIAWDNSGQRIFVADSGTGELAVVNSDGSRDTLVADLTSPAGVAYDSGLIFVAEPALGRVSAYSADLPPTPTRTPSFSPTPSPLPSATATPTATRTVTPTRTPTASATTTRTATETPILTATRASTETAIPTSSPTVAPSATTTPTAALTATSTPVPTPTVAPCPGDVNGDGQVTVDELVLAVRAALGEVPGRCSAAGGE